jgi:hypothetical protein
LESVGVVKSMRFRVRQRIQRRRGPRLKKKMGGKNGKKMGKKTHISRYTCRGGEKKRQRGPCAFECASAERVRGGLILKKKRGKRHTLVVTHIERVGGSLILKKKGGKKTLISGVTHIERGLTWKSCSTLLIACTQ